MPDSPDFNREAPTFSRRAVVKGAGAGAGLGLLSLAGLKAADPGQIPVKDVLKFVANKPKNEPPSASPPSEQPTPHISEIHHTDGPHADQLPPTEDPFIASIEDRRDTRIISERKQGEEIKKVYPDLDPDYIDALPEHLDHERAALLDAIWDTLPESFYSPYSKGNPLVMAIADFGTHTSIVGETEIDNPYRNIIALTSRQFTPENKANAASIAVHEMTHFKQHKGELFLQKQIPGIFDKSLPELFDYTLTRLDDSSVQAACSPDFLFNLRYGVKNLLGKNETRTDTTEYDAVFSQFYYNGKDYFMTNVGAVYGQDKAVMLYEFYRDNVFEGREYEQNPFATPPPETPVATQTPEQSSATEVPTEPSISQNQQTATDSPIVPRQTESSLGESIGSKVADWIKSMKQTLNLNKQTASSPNPSPQSPRIVSGTGDSEQTATEAPAQPNGDLTPPVLIGPVGTDLNNPNTGQDSSSTVIGPVGADQGDESEVNQTDSSASGSVDTSQTGTDNPNQDAVATDAPIEPVGN